MRHTLLMLAILGFVLLPSLVLAGPPAGDLHNSCVTPAGAMGPFTLPPLPTVPATMSHFMPLGTSLPACFALGPGMAPFAPYVSEWGGHGPGCPPPPFVGAITGAYCGPVIPPGGAATCSWVPVFNTVPTGLVLGFGAVGALPPLFPPPPPPALPVTPGFVNLAVSGELPVFGPFPPSTSTLPPTGWTVFNPYVPPFLPPTPARVIAFPTDLVGPGFAGGDMNLITC